uniref:Uncharacterized protein n=1 Tax=Meloidogyne incognita TaxID=6306 RepID=A0A914M2Z2_MELIC
MSSDEYVDPSSDSEYEYDNPLKNKIGKLHELHKKFQAENANNAFSSSSDSEIDSGNNRGCGMLSVGTVDAEVLKQNLFSKKENDPSSSSSSSKLFNHQSTSAVINNKNNEVKVEKKKKKIIKTEVKKNVKMSKKKKNKRDSRSRSNSTPVNNCEEEENSPTILRPYLPRMAKDFTKAIKLTYATPQFQNQRRRGEFRSDSGQSSRTYSRSRSPITSAADDISSATKKCCNIIGTYHEPSECPILLEKHSQPNEEG